jgi:hypothetical protein
MLLDFLLAQDGQVITPASHDTGNQSLTDQIAQPQVSHVEVGRIDAAQVLFPRVARFVSPARIELRHVGIQPCHNLNDRKSLSDAIGSQSLEVFGPAQPLAKRHPPSISQPEERRSIGMLKMPSIGRNLYGAVPVQRMVSAIGDRLKRTGAAMQVPVGGIAATRAIAVTPRAMGRKANRPVLFPSPESRNALFKPV